MTALSYQALAKEYIKSGAWYYGVRCDCGLQIIVHEDSSQGFGDEFLELSRPIAVECTCGAVSRAQRFQKFKTP
jgi:hypothetical protein